MMNVCHIQYVISMLTNLNLSRNDKSGLCELCNTKFDQKALEAIKIAYIDAEETDQATIKGFDSFVVLIDSLIKSLYIRKNVMTSLLMVHFNIETGYMLTSNTIRFLVSSWKF